MYGRFEPPRGEIEIRDLATFRFETGRGQVTAYAVAASAEEDVVHAFHTTVLPLIAWACEGAEAFHASAVRRPRGVVALAGPSESGKSTLAFGLAVRGYERFAEDAVAFRVAEEIRAIPLPFTTNLREASAKHFAGSAHLLPPSDEVREAGGPEPPFEALILLDPRSSGATVVTRLGAPEALLALLPNAYRFKNQPAARERSMLEAYLALASQVPVLRLSYPQDFGRFDDVLDHLVESVEALGS